MSPKNGGRHAHAPTCAGCHWRIVRQCLAITWPESFRSNYWRTSRGWHPAPGLDCPSQPVDNDRMRIPGRVHDGVVVSNGGPACSEGTPVTVLCDVAPVFLTPRKKTRVKFPLVHPKNPGILHLTGQRIAEILDQEEATLL